MKAGDTAYLVESNRFVHDVELLTSWKTVKSISQAPEHNV